MKRATMADTVQKLRGFAAQGGFTVEDPPIERLPGRTTQVVRIRPDGGTLMRLTQREAEVYVSGYVTGRKSGIEWCGDQVEEARAHGVVLG